LALFVSDQFLRIVDPAVSAVFLAKSIFDRVAAFLEQLGRLSFDCG